MRKTRALTFFSPIIFFQTDAIRATDGNPIACPANWTPQQDVIVALSLSDDAAREKFGELDIKLPYLRFAKAPNPNA